ncbi:MAG: hypothetical protein FJX46_15960, partial [Alphaproteobacteria bacterium]|nr:hypothetical protein [Alphaproteobacteria bacterium]
MATVAPAPRPPTVPVATPAAIAQSGDPATQIFARAFAQSGASAYQAPAIYQPMPQVQPAVAVQPAMAVQPAAASQDTVVRDVYAATLARAFGGQPVAAIPAVVQTAPRAPAVSSITAPIEVEFAARSARLTEAQRNALRAVVERQRQTAGPVAVTGHATPLEVAG